MKENKDNISVKVCAAVLSAVIACSTLTACSIKFNIPKETTTHAETTVETTTVPETTVPPVVSKHAIDGSIPESAKVDSTYFDDAVFIGDSISDMLKFYEMANDKLGKAQFLTAGSLSATNALWDLSNPLNVFPVYNGKKMKLEDAVVASGARKIYIMLGMNDISMGEEAASDNYVKVINNIKKAAPDTVIFVESVTPRVDIPAAHSGKLTNDTITSYNKKMSAICKENGWYFLNVAEVMFDDAGFLKKEYCSDANNMGMHFTYDGCEKWIEYLYTHTVNLPPATSTTTSSSATNSSESGDGSKSSTSPFVSKSSGNSSEYTTGLKETTTSNQNTTIKG